MGRSRQTQGGELESEGSAWRGSQMSLNTQTFSSQGDRLESSPRKVLGESRHLAKREDMNRKRVCVLPPNIWKTYMLEIDVVTEHPQGHAQDRKVDNSREHFFPPLSVKNLITVWDALEWTYLPVYAVNSPSGEVFKSGPENLWVSKGLTIRRFGLRDL